MLRRCLLAVLSAVLALPLLAQKPAPPDLSGTWVLNTSKSKLPKSKLPKSAVPDPERLVITCAGDRIEMHFKFDGRESTTWYIADGHEHPTAEWQETTETSAKTSWIDSVLVTETIKRDVVHATLSRSTERWSLSSDGRVLTRELLHPKLLFAFDKQ
jgi:hypothetical protein